VNSEYKEHANSKGSDLPFTNLRKDELSSSTSSLNEGKTGSYARYGLDSQQFCRFVTVFWIVQAPRRCWCHAIADSSGTIDSADVDAEEYHRSARNHRSKLIFVIMHHNWSVISKVKKKRRAREWKCEYYENVYRFLKRSHRILFPFH
jgi:hypothetical protein